MRTSIAHILGILLLLAPAAAQAADGAAAPATSFNPVLILLATLVVVLGAAVALLGNVLHQLVFVYRDKMRKDRAAAAAKALLMAVLLFSGFAATAGETAPAAEATAAAETVSPYIAGIARFDFYCIIGVMAFELLLIGVLLILIRSMVRTLRNVPEKAPVMERILSRNMLDVFNKSVAIEKEEGILMDHEYDGIRELDNSLPPWWKYGFYLTIFVAVVYIWHYHFGDGPSQQQEYLAAVEKAEVEKAEYLAKHAASVDENNLAAVTDAAELGNIQTLFQNTCAACHGKDGGGAVGPNLTDEYWLHGGSLKDVFKSIKYGWSDKGMPSWETSLSPKQVATMASYIKTLQGTHPAAPKAPQGDKYVENSGNGKPAADSSAAPKKLAMATP